MARHKRPWCRSCGKRKARGLYEDDGFCSIRCAANGMYALWSSDITHPDWCHRCGRWSEDGEIHSLSGTHTWEITDFDREHGRDKNRCACHIPIPDGTGEPYIREEYDD
jgi:hypothetical protein